MNASAEYTLNITTKRGYTKFYFPLNSKMKTALSCPQEFLYLNMILQLEELFSYDRRDVQIKLIIFQWILFLFSLFVWKDFWSLLSTGDKRLLKIKLPQKYHRYHVKKTYIFTSLLQVCCPSFCFIYANIALGFHNLKQVQKKVIL